MTRTEALDLRKKVVDGETHEALRPYIEKAAASLDDNDAYAAWDKVSHNGKNWKSTCDGNVWEPGVYGWTEEAP